MSGQQTRTFSEAVEQYAQLGLRTLCLAWREVQEDEYQEWSLMFKEANSTLVDREVRLQIVCWFFLYIFTHSWFFGYESLWLPFCFWVS